MFLRTFFMLTPALVVFARMATLILPTLFILTILQHDFATWKPQQGAELGPASPNKGWSLFPHCLNEDGFVTCFDK